MKKFIIVTSLLSLVCEAKAQFVAYDQPAHSSGVLFQSSRMDVNGEGSDIDRVIWDDFTLGSAQTISEIRWMGGRDPAHDMGGGPVTDFTVAIFSSIPGGSEPDLTSAPLIQLTTGGDASQTPAGVFNGTPLFQYSLSLPAPFQASAGNKYWLQVQAAQAGMPDWGIASATGGDNSYFGTPLVHGSSGFSSFQGDLAFSLVSPVPEPESAGLAGLAALGVGLGMRRIRKRSAAKK